MKRMFQIGKLKRRTITITMLFVKQSGYYYKGFDSSLGCVVYMPRMMIGAYWGVIWTSIEDRALISLNFGLPLILLM